MKMVQDLSRYSDKAIDSLIEQAPGTPFKDETGMVVGTVISAKRVSETRLVQFEVAPLKEVM